MRTTDDAFNLPEMRSFMGGQPPGIHVHGSFERLSAPVTIAVRDQLSSVNGFKAAKRSARWSVKASSEG
jgi:hypothetical protein